MPMWVRGYIEHSGEQYLIRVPGQVVDIEDIRQNYHRELAKEYLCYIKDVAEVLLGKELRTGLKAEDGKEVVLGTVCMLIGENGRTVSRRVAEKMVEINRTLPEGIVAKTIYDRTTLVEATVNTVKKNLAEGCAPS